jgi:Fe2+ transport system protein FeoA
MTQRLVSCRAGDRVIVGAIEASPSRVDRLASIGIVPGIELVVQQTRPVVVVECDENVLAFEREIAAEIVVAKASPEAPAALGHAGGVATAITALAFAISFGLGLSGCTSETHGPNAAGPLPPIAEVHAEKCGACHSLPAPRTRSREYLEQAFSRHHRRVHLTSEDWAAMVEYLAAPGASVAVQTAR